MNCGCGDISSGSLDQTLAFQREVLVSDGAGGSTKSWTTYATVWGMVKALSGRERDASAQTESPRNYRFTIRNRSDVLAKDRIVWLGKTVNITFIRYEGPRPMFLEIEGLEGVAT